MTIYNFTISKYFIISIPAIQCHPKWCKSSDFKPKQKIIDSAPLEAGASVKGYLCVKRMMISHQGLESQNVQDLITNWVTAYYDLTFDWGIKVTRSGVSILYEIIPFESAEYN